MNFRKFAIALLALIPSLAVASAECDWAIQVNKDVPARIGARNAKIAQDGQLIAQERATIDAQLTPQLNALTSEIGVYDTGSDAVRRSQLGIKEALLFIQSTIINNKALKIALNQMNRSVKMDPSQSLADQIRATAEKSRLTSATREKLNQLANTVAVLEASQTDWLKNEQELLQGYLDGKTTMVDGLFNELNQLNESLSASLTNMASGKSNDEKKRDQVAEAIKAAQDRIAQHNTEIQNLQQQNEGDAKYAKIWDPDLKCPHDPLPRPRFPVF